LSNLASIVAVHTGTARWASVLSARASEAPLESGMAALRIPTYEGDGWSKFLELREEGSMKRLMLFGLLVVAALSAIVGVPAAIADGGGDGGPQLVFLSDPSPDYGYVAPGSVETKTFTVENVGSGKGGQVVDMGIGSGGWGITNDGCAWITLAPGQTCSITIIYEPLNPGDYLNASLTVWAKNAQQGPDRIPDNRAKAAATITLTGTTDAPVSP
jgi:hypothetical protein